MIKYEDIAKANEQINSITLERKDKKTGKIVKKDYAEVHQRIKAFRMVYPQGNITTEILSCTDGICTMKATVSDGSGYVLATGHAQEKEKGSYINATSYIENCETSAVGRALGMAGFGIDTSVASADEIQNADLNAPLEEKYLKALSEGLKKHKKKATDLEALKGVKSQQDITFTMWKAAIEELERGDDDEQN